MSHRPPVYRPSDIDHKQAEHTRGLTEQARELLKLPKPDSFLGRKTHEPFPLDQDEE